MSKKLTIEEVKNYIESFGYKLHSIKYKGSHKKLEIECIKGHTYKHSCWHSFKRGQRCPKCAGNKKLTYEFVKEYIESFSYSLLSEEYINAHQKLEIRCDRGHIYFVAFNSFKNINQRCPECYKIKITGEGHPNWKGGVIKKNIPLYDTYAHQISWCEETRRDSKNRDYLQVRCTNSGCRKWFMPTLREMWDRLYALKSINGTESRFYCSKKCKDTCSIFWQVKYPKGFIQEDRIRYDQKEWADMVKERDNYECVKCASKENIVAHHIEGLNINPIMSADIDIGITLCKECHKEAHIDIDCRFVDLRRDKLCYGIERG